MKKSELKQLIRGILEEVKKSQGLSGFKKVADDKENTEMKSDEKSITNKEAPKEVEMTKKLPVVKKPATPKMVKEQIIDMIHEAIMDEMAKSPVTIDNGVVKGGVANKFRKQDANSPTGWVMNGHPKIPDGTPVEAPKNTGNNYVSQNKQTVNSVGGDSPIAGTEDDSREEDDEIGIEPEKSADSSDVNVKVNGKSIGKFGFKLPSGKIDSRPMKVMVNSFIYKNPDMGAYDISQSVFDKFDQLSDLYSDDKLPMNAAINLSVSNGILTATK